MGLNRVVITGMGGISPLGATIPQMVSAIEAGASAIRRMPDAAEAGLRCELGAPAELINEKQIPRDARRSMGRMSIFSVQAATAALEDAGIGPDLLSSGRLGCVIGSTIGSTASIADLYGAFARSHSLATLVPTKFFHCISNTAVMNVVNTLGITGWMQAPCGACASGALAVGEALDLIRLGRQDVMLAGGAEELHPIATGMFDLLNATSTGYNDRPEAASRPFDRDRDGLVCGEGAGILVLESYAHAAARGAKIYAEVKGFSLSANGLHVSQSNNAGMIRCIRGALADAGIRAEDVDYINAHATGTPQGDSEEAGALRTIFGGNTPVSSLKGYLGHTLGASGALELAATLHMMEKGVLYPTRNLEHVADECAGLHHLTRFEECRVEIVLKNSFGFGGVNCALVLTKA